MITAVLIRAVVRVLVAVIMTEKVVLLLVGNQPLAIVATMFVTAMKIQIPVQLIAEVFKELE